LKLVWGVSNLLSFQVLIDLKTNVSSVQEDIARLQEDSAKLNAQNQAYQAHEQAVARSLTASRLEQEAKLKTAVADRQKAEQAIAAIKEQLDKRAAELQAQQITNQNALKAAVQGQGNNLDIITNSLKQQLALQQDALKAANDQVAAEKAILNQKKEAIRVQQEDVAQQSAQNRAGIAANRQAVASNVTQIQRTRAVQQPFVSAGLVAATSGIPGLAQIGAISTAFGYGGPVSAGAAVIVESIKAIVSGITSAVDLMKSMTFEAYNLKN
jgi:hypothetical protein